MKCPKCGYTSFDYLDECKKCGRNLAEHKDKFNIRSLMFPGQGGAAAAAAAPVAATAGENEEFGFDFMEEGDAEGGTPIEFQGTPEPAPAAESSTGDTFSFDDDSFSFDDRDDDQL